MSMVLILTAKIYLMHTPLYLVCMYDLPDCELRLSDEEGPFYSMLEQTELEPTHCAGVYMVDPTEKIVEQPSLVLLEQYHPDGSVISSMTDLTSGKVANSALPPVPAVPVPAPAASAAPESAPTVLRHELDAIKRKLFDKAI
jgi:hypothetical protein